MRKVLGLVAMVVVTALVAWPTYRGQVMAQVPPADTGGVSLVVVDDIQPKPSGTRRQPLAYSVKFVCGTVLANPSDPQQPADPDAPAVPGTYLTEITLFNRRAPSLSSPGALVDLLAVVGTERGAPRAPLGHLTSQAVLPNQAVTIDCGTLYNLLGRVGSAAGPYISGYLTIYSDTELDISAVYTTRT